MSLTDEHDAKVSTGWTRLGVGLVQGLAAWLLIRGADGPFGQHNPGLFAALALITAFPPLIVLAGLGRMRLKTLVIWTVAAALLLAALAFYDLWREPLDNTTARRWPSAQLAFFGGVVIYIAHHLIEPADIERRLFPSYQGRFESAWRHGFQLALALVFTGVFWGVLQLGAALFNMIGITALSVLMRQTWFVSPATAAAFAGAVHLTDVRPGLIRGVRTVGLTLLSWLLPLMAGLTALFLVALIFTGVTPLWATRRAAALLLSAAAVLIVLINAAYQDGQDRERLPTALRWSGRGAAVLLAPLTVLAGWATALRIGQYGLTPERVVSVALLVAAALYAAGYAWAAFARGPWLKRIETVNVAAAVAILAMIVLVLSPVADPARLSVSDQVHRLEAKAIPVDRFDFKFLHFHAARFGRDAMTRLAASPDPAIAAAARKAQAEPEFEPAGAKPKEPAFTGVKVWPAGTVLPASFRGQAFSSDNAWEANTCLTGGAACDLYLRDVDGDGKAEVLVSANGQLMVYRQGADAKWSRLGVFDDAGCSGVEEALHAGKVRPLAPLIGDLDAGGTRLRFQSTHACDPAHGAPPSPTDHPPAGLGPAFRQP